MSSSSDVTSSAASDSSSDTSDAGDNDVAHDPLLDMDDVKDKSSSSSTSSDTASEPDAKNPAADEMDESSSSSDSDAETEMGDANPASDDDAKSVDSDASEATVVECVEVKRTACRVRPGVAKKKNGVRAIGNKQVNTGKRSWSAAQRREADDAAALGREIGKSDQARVLAEKVRSLVRTVVHRNMSNESVDKMADVIRGALKASGGAGRVTRTTRMVGAKFLNAAKNFAKSEVVFELRNAAVTTSSSVQQTISKVMPDVVEFLYTSMGPIVVDIIPKIISILISGVAKGATTAVVAAVGLPENRADAFMERLLAVKVQHDMTLREALEAQALEGFREGMDTLARDVKHGDLHEDERAIEHIFEDTMREHEHVHSERRPCHSGDRAGISPEEQREAVLRQAEQYIALQRQKPAARVPRTDAEKQKELEDALRVVNDTVDKYAKPVAESSAQAASRATRILASEMLDINQIQAVLKESGAKGRGGKGADAQVAALVRRLSLHSKALGDAIARMTRKILRDEAVREAAAKAARGVATGVTDVTPVLSDRMAEGIGQAVAEAASKKKVRTGDLAGAAVDGVESALGGLDDADRARLSALPWDDSHGDDKMIIVTFKTDKYTAIDVAIPLYDELRARGEAAEVVYALGMYALFVLSLRRDGLLMIREHTIQRLLETRMLRPQDVRVRTPVPERFVQALVHAFSGKRMTLDKNMQMAMMIGTIDEAKSNSDEKVIAHFTDIDSAYNRIVVEGVLELAMAMLIVDCVRTNSPFSRTILHLPEFKTMLE